MSLWLSIKKCMIQWHLYASYQLNNLGQSLNFCGPIHTFSGPKFLKCKREVEIYPPLSHRSEWLSSSEGSQGKIFFYQLWLPWKKRTLFLRLNSTWLHIAILHWADCLCYPVWVYSLQCRDSFLLDSSVAVSVRSSIPFQATEPKASAAFSLGALAPGREWKSLSLSTSCRLTAWVFLFHAQEKQSWCPASILWFSMLKKNSLDILHQYYGYCKFYA